MIAIISRPRIINDIAITGHFHQPPGCPGIALSCLATADRHAKPLGPQSNDIELRRVRLRRVNAGWRREKLRKWKWGGEAVRLSSPGMQQILHQKLSPPLPSAQRPPQPSLLLQVLLLRPKILRKGKPESPHPQTYGGEALFLQVLWCSVFH